MADHKFKQMEEQLKRIGCNFQFWGRSELKELAHVLLDGEIIEHCINGFYDGGFALCAATNQRVLIVDKKPFYLNLEDIRFDMISEIDYNHRLLDASVLICTPNKSLKFSAFNQTKARRLFQFVQHKVMEVRERYLHQVTQPQYLPQMPVQQTFLAPPYPSAEWLAYAQQLQQASTVPSLPPQPNYSPQLAHHFHVPQPQTLARRVPPIISAYTRLPMRSRQRRFLGSRALT